MPDHTNRRLAPAALACALLASGCSSTLLGLPRPPPGWRDWEQPQGRGCPDLTGTFENLAVALVRMQGFEEGAERNAKPDRHLAAIFTAVERPGRIERITIEHPAPDRVRFLLEAAGDQPDQVIEVAERRDFTCSKGRATFDDSPAVRRREGGSIRLARDGNGCLMLRARQRDGWAFLLFLPLVEHRSAEWSRFCPPGRSGASQEAVSVLASGEVWP